MVGLLQPAAELSRIECNGMLFGVLAEVQYPVKQMTLKAGDRLLLYTDGLTEPESDRGEPFGDHRLEALVRDNRARPAQEFIDRLLLALEAWRPASAVQEDDITVVAIDVL